MLQQESAMEQARMIRKQVRQYLVSQGQMVYSEEEIVLTPVFSLTNDVFRVDVDGRILLFKIYKPSLPQFTNNSLEILIVTKLAQQNLYPRILHYTSEYRIEQFLEAQQSKSGSLSQPKLLSIIKKLTYFSRKFSEGVEGFHIKAGILHRFSLQNLLHLCSSIYEAKRQECPTLVQQCSSEIESVLNNKHVLENLLEILRETPRMLCHNDCHIGNLLITSTEEYILDFEFANFNYVGYDLGNFLNEWATEYGSSFEIREDLEMEEGLKDSLIRAYFEGLGASIIGESTLKQWRYFVQLGRVLSHLFWMIIGLKQINDARIGFSMVYYIRRRQQEFLRHWGKLLQLSNDF